MQPERIVDFGCGSGLFTACLAETAAEGVAVLATDFHPAAPRELGVTPYRPMAELDQLAGTADLLIAMHVLEHDDDSLKLLERMIALVRPGGRLLIEVPNVDCAWVSVFGRHWDAWYLPYHRVHFSRPSLRALIARSGLKLVDEYDAAVPTMGRTLANMLGMRNGPIFVLLSAALHPLQLLVERLTGRPSALRVLAEKV
jgi:SAM-dependent methyltransferase